MTDEDKDITEHLTEPGLIGIIIVREFEDGTIDWSSSYEDIDDFFEVLNIVAEEACEPELEVHPLH